MTRAPSPVVVVLSSDEVEELARPWNGAGGFQNLAPKLSNAVQANGSLSLEDEDVGIIMRHMSYANSGFRDKVRKIFQRSFKEVMSRK